MPKRRSWLRVDHLQVGSRHVSRRNPQHLVAPLIPAGPSMSGEQLQERSPATLLDDVVKLVRLPAVLPLPGRKQVRHGAARLQGAYVVAARSEQDQFRHVAEVETHPPPIRSRILANLVPDEIGLVGEPSPPHRLQTIWQERVRYPEIKMCGRCGKLPYRQHKNVIDAHARVAKEPLVLRGYFPRAIMKSPGWISHDRRKFLTSP